MKQVLAEAAVACNDSTQSKMDDPVGKRRWSKPDVIMVCAPNSGVMDAWAPVLWHLKSQRPDWRYLLFFPNKRTVKEFLRNASVLVELTGQIMDTYVYPTLNGNWIRMENMEEVRKSLEARSMAIKPRRKAPVHDPATTMVLKGLSNILKKLELVRFQGRITALEDIFHPQAIILSDLEILKFRYEPPFLGFCSRGKFFSLAHGLEIKAMKSVKGTVRPVAPNMVPGDARAYLFSDREVTHYETIFHLNREQMAVVGVPRHDEEWLRFVIAREEERTDWNKRDYVFLISRHVGMLPAERKKAYVEWIRDVVWHDLGLGLVIKTHPREYGESVYEEVLGLENKGTRWHVQEQHAFVLGSRAKFAICFYSGVPLDMIRIDIPTVELLDIRGLPSLDNEEAFRDEAGNPVLQYRYNGLVLGAGTREEFKTQVERIMNDRDGVVGELRRKYEEIFATMPESSKWIAEDIARRATEESAN